MRKCLEVSQGPKTLSLPYKQTGSCRIFAVAKASKQNPTAHLFGLNCRTQDLRERREEIRSVIRAPRTLHTYLCHYRNELNEHS